MKRGFVLIACLVVLGLAGQSKAELWKKGETIHIAHRGARAEYDENTLEAFKRAVELGVDMVEFDIQRTSDKRLVIMHDETVDRTTNGTGRVDQMTLAEFKKLRTKSGYQPPTLDEALTYFEGNEVNLILDFKIPDKAVAERLIELVLAHGLEDRVIFESSVPEVAAAIEKDHPELVTSIYPTDMYMMRRYLKKDNIDVASYLYLFASPLEVMLVHAKGKQVMVWTVNSKALIRWFKFIKVDGIMTDDPRLFN